METKEPNLAAFNEWVCIESHNSGTLDVYVEGQSYWFHEDSLPGEQFRLVVDQEDYPIKKLVRWD